MNPALGAVTVRTNGADSIYHAGQFTLDRNSLAVFSYAPRTLFEAD